MVGFGQPAEGAAQIVEPLLGLDGRVRALVGADEAKVVARPSPPSAS